MYVEEIGGEVIFFLKSVAIKTGTVHFFLFLDKRKKRKKEGIGI